jgi:ABC-type branched-subunit amino acid transport system ATPase component
MVELVAQGVSVVFEGLVAVNGVDMALRPNEIVGLIGPNGAGKTTLVNVLSGFQCPSSGEVTVAGHRVCKWRPQTLVKHGVARTFQGGRTFRGLTVQENVETAALGVGVSARVARRTARELLDLFGLGDRAQELAAGLPYGDERRLGIARALATSPQFLLLDEPAAGMNEGETDDLVRTLKDLRSSAGYGMLIIEHDMRLISELPERIYVLVEGSVLAEGPTREVMRDAAVVCAYLGEAGACSDACR